MATIKIPTMYVRYAFECEHCGTQSGPRLANLANVAVKNINFREKDGRIVLDLSNYRNMKGKCASCRRHQTWEEKGMAQALGFKLGMTLLITLLASLVAVIAEEGDFGLMLMYLSLFVGGVAALYILITEGIRYAVIHRDAKKAPKHNDVFYLPS